MSLWCCLCLILSIKVRTSPPLCCLIISPQKNICWQCLPLSPLWSITGATKWGVGGRLLLFGHYPPPPPNPISTPRPVSCRLSNNVMEASMLGILSRTVGKQWEGCVEDGVYASVCVCVCVWRVDGLRGCYCETEGKQWRRHSARQDPG